MAGSKVRMGDLTSAIKRALDETKTLTNESLKRAIDATAKETANKIRGKAPVKTRKYAPGWTSKAEKAGNGKYARTVYQRKKPQLSHLLQNGHGGPMPAASHPHIPSDEETEKLLEKNLESEMKKG